jgi:hypothetical protein
MSNLLTELKEYINVGSHKKLEYNLDEQIKLLKLLASHKNLDPIIESLHDIFLNNWVTESDANVSIAIHSINQYISSHYNVVNEITIKKRKRKRKPNSKLSQIAKRRYKKNKGKIKRALNKFHKSTKGKSFHKALGKYISRKNKGKTSNSSMTNPDLVSKDLHDLLVIANSAMLQLGLYLRDNIQNDELSELDEDDYIYIQDIYNACISDMFTAMRSPDDDKIDYIEEISGELANLFTDYEIDFEEDDSNYNLDESMTDGAHLIKEKVKPILMQAVEVASEVTGKSGRECFTEIVELLNHISKKYN